MWSADGQSDFGKPRSVVGGTLQARAWEEHCCCHHAWQGQAVGWRPLHHAVGGDTLRLREAKAWLYSMRRAARRLLLPSGGILHGARQGGADNVPQCGDWNKVTISRLVALEKDLQRMTQVMKAWHQIQVRAVLGSGANYDKEMLLLNAFFGDGPSAPLPCFGASHLYSATTLGGRHPCSTLVSVTCVGCACS